MSEEQGKPNGKKRDILSLILFTILMLVVLAAVFYHISRPPLGPDRVETVWLTYQDLIKNAVVSYKTDHNGSLPILNVLYSNANCSNCNVINISALLVTNGGLFIEVPEGCYLSATGNDNCGGNASLGCWNYSSYIWIVDTNGSVFSYCAGAGCATNNSGFQDVWP